MDYKPLTPNCFSIALLYILYYTRIVTINPHLNISSLYTVNSKLYTAFMYNSEKYYFEPSFEVHRNNKTYYYGRDISDDGYNYDMLPTNMYELGIYLPDYHNFCFEDLLVLLKVQNAETDEERASIINNQATSSTVFTLSCFGYVLLYHIVYNGKNLVKECIGTEHTSWWEPVNLTVDELMTEPLPKKSMDIYGHLSDKEFMGKYHIGFRPDSEVVKIPQGYKYLQGDKCWTLHEGIMTLEFL